MTYVDATVFTHATSKMETILARMEPRTNELLSNADAKMSVQQAAITETQAKIQIDSALLTTMGEHSQVV